MTAPLVEARRRRLELERSLRALRQDIDGRFADMLTELMEIERLERLAEAQHFELEPELHTEALR